MEPLPLTPRLGALHFAPSETESGQLVKGPASLKIDKLEGLTERIRIGTTGRSYQMHKEKTGPHCSKTDGSDRDREEKTPQVLGLGCWHR